MNFWFIYNGLGQITQKILATTLPTAFASQTYLGPFPQASASTTVLLAYANPERYLVQGTPPALVEQPFWTVTAAESASTTGQYAMTATLNNPGSSVPSTAIFAVAGGTINATVSSNQATATIQLHASVASQPVAVQVSATGTVSGQTTINSGTAGIGLQLITSGTTPLVAPVGAGSKAYLRAHYLGLTPATQIAILTEALQNLMITAAVSNRILTEKILPALQATTYTPITLTPAESAALTNWTANVQSNLVAWADLLDGSGQPIPAYSELQTQAPQVLTAMTAYNTAVASLPGLA